MKKLIYSFAIVLISINLPAQNFQWAQSIGSVANEQPFESLAMDGNGNIYLAGSAVYAVNVNGFTLHDPFIAKFNSSGQLIYAFTDSCSVQKLEIDASGNIVTLCEGVRFIKYDSMGNVIFNKWVDPSCTQMFCVGGAYDFCLDHNGNIYALGVKWDCDGSHSWKSFVYKLDVNGNFIWSYNQDCLGDYFHGGYGRKIICDQNNDLIITGYFDGQQNFFNDTIISPNGVSVFKIDTASNLIWGTFLFNTFPNFSNGFWNESFHINCDASNNIYFGLSQSGQNIIYIAKISSAGNILMAKPVFTSNEMPVAGIVPTDAGGFLITNNFTGTNMFASSVFTSTGSSDFLISYFNSQGDFQFAHQLGNIYKESVTSIVKDQSGSIYLAGNFGYDSLSPIGGTLNLGNIQLTSSGWNDIFIAKLAPSLTAINNVQLQQSPFEIFPNPFHTTASFYFNNKLHSDKIKLIIYDISGRQMQTVNLINGNNLISRNGMDSGIYFYKVSDDGTMISTGKLIIE